MSAEADTPYAMVVQTVLIAGVSVVAIVDTGSNISIMRSGLLHDTSQRGRSSSPHAKFAMDMTKMRSRRVVFHTSISTATDIPIAGATMPSTSAGRHIELPPFVCCMLDLQQVLPNFPSHVDMILGTNALAGTIVLFKGAGGPLLMSRSALTRRLSSTHKPPLAHLRTTTCDQALDDLGPLFMADTDVGHFLLDTGNHFSPFCSLRLGPTCIPRLLFATTPPVQVAGPLAIMRMPQSLGVIGNWCPINVVGNLGSSIFAGGSAAQFPQCVFDFGMGNVYCQLATSPAQSTKAQGVNK